ncbi:hypothetical protein MLD38_019463 [Melastoma candidum]|uniref:Uncharacterized protein n=1 Tax=Melastoma candidum TaxID=119954 RepID=A0ACB9QX58_9MYRT|nr:hypothetical protein MLD38_019463 [Melastoma candidum]
MSTTLAQSYQLSPFLEESPGVSVCVFGFMGPLWFFLSCLLVVTGAASLPPGKELEPELSPVYFDVHHGHGSLSPDAGESAVSFLDVLAHDENRIRVLTRRIAHSKGRKSAPAARNSTRGLVGPQAVSTPVSSGLSIGSGNYYVKVGLGSPAKYYSLILDTGSSLSWLQCEPCIISCHAQVDPIFNPSASKTYKTLSCSTSQCLNLKEATLNEPLCESQTGKCIYTASYGDSSFSIGYLSQDFLSLSPSESFPNFIYGCGQDNEGLFGRSAGIIGLARQKLSLLSQLSPRYGYAFYYCLPTATSSSSGGGYLAIGKASVSASAYKFTPMITNPSVQSLYFLRLVGITISGKAIGVSAGAYNVPTIIDSGTVITRLPDSVYAALKQAFVKVISAKYSQAASYSILDTCFKGRAKGLSVPQIRMVFQGGADLALNSLNILVDVDGGRTCLAFTGGSRIAIIGNHQQQTFSIAYDVSNSRIGFAAGGCR